jgi:hypothetical protein
VGCGTRAVTAAVYGGLAWCAAGVTLAHQRKRGVLLSGRSNPAVEQLCLAVRRQWESGRPDSAASSCSWAIFNSLKGTKLRFINGKKARFVCW